MQIDWPADFDAWLDDLEARVEKGEAHAKQILILVTAALKHLQELKEPPTRDTETATLRWIRQSKRYPLWRVSHPYRAGVAVRLICWFPPDSAPWSSRCSPVTKRASATCSTTPSAFVLTGSSINGNEKR